jgi:WD40 repeat protein
MTCWSDLLIKLVMSPTVCHYLSHAVACLYTMIAFKKQVQAQLRLSRSMPYICCLLHYYNLNCSGTHLFTGDSSADLATNLWSLTPHVHLVISLQIISSVSDHTIRVWDSHTGLEVQRLVGHEAQVHILECHPLDHRLAMSASYDGTTRLWNLYTGQPLARYNKHAWLHPSCKPMMCMPSDTLMYGVMQTYSSKSG